MSDFIIFILVLSVGMSALTFFGLRLRDALRRWHIPEPEDPPRKDAIIHPTDPPEDRARKMMDEVEDFGARLRSRVLIEVDEEETPDTDDPDKPHDDR